MLKMGISSVLSLVLILLAAPAASGQDINGDGRVDAVFTQKQRYNQVCFGNGTGAFTTCSDLIGAGSNQLSNQVNTTASVLVDWDTDGDLDIVLAMEGRSSVVCYNDGAGQFNSGLGCVELFGYNTFPYNTQDVAVGDLNADGAPDLVFANGGNAGLPLNQPNMVCLGGGGCYEFGTTPAPSTGLALGDVDNDGDLDILVSNRGIQNEVCLRSGSDFYGPVFDCRAIPQAVNVSATKNSNAVAVGHLAPGSGSTPDNYLDIAFANDGKNEVCFGDGNWSGTAVGFMCSGLNTVSSYTLNDANANTVDVAIDNIMPHAFYVGPEIIFANTDAPNVRCYTTFTCTFAFQPSQIVDWNGFLVSEPVPDVTTGVAIRDINIDGKLDVVVANDGISRSYMRADCCGSTDDVVANSQLHPTSITLSGGTVGPSVDTEPPNFVGATNITPEAVGPTGAIVTFTVTAVDIEDGSRPVTCAPASGGLFPIGPTTVTCTSSDTSGNVGTATFVVSVVDTTGPVVTVPNNIAVLATPGQTTTAVTFAASAVDAVDGARSVICSNPATHSGVSSGDQFAGGTTTLACGAYDTRSNYGESTFTVTVTTDIDSDGILDDVDLDDDGDGIADTLDTQPLVASNEYGFDGTNTGTVTRNGWTVIIAAPPSGSAYAMRASVSGAGTAPAVIRADCGNFRRKELRLDAAGETIEWRCEANSLTVNFVSGTTEFWKVICGGGSCVWTQITSTGGGSGATAGSPVTAHATNTAPVAVTLFDDNLMEIGSFSLDAGESVAVDVVDVGGEPTLQLELLNGGPDGIVAVTLFGQPVPLQQGSGPALFDITPDVTAPVVAAQVNGLLGNNGYYTSDVTVTWTVTDAESAATSTGCATQSVVQDTTGVTFTCAAESEGGTASESVTIKRDATAPVITMPADITTAASSASGAVVTYAATVQDVLDATPFLSCAPASGSTFVVGASTVTCTATDAAGNSASSTFTVTVTNTAPTFTAPADQTVEATSASGAVVTYAATGADVEDGPLAADCAPASGLTFPLGTTIVSCSVTDRAGATASGTFRVLVVDTTAPSIAATADISVTATSAAGAVVTYATPATTDEVDGTGAATCAPASGSTFVLGVTTVTCTATDAASHSASSTFTVTVTNTAPTFTAPADQTVEATSASGAVVTYAAAGADAEDGPLAAVCAPASESTFPLGTTVVNCTVTDSAGATAAGTFTVTVADTTAPSVAATADISVTATSAAGAVVTYTTPATTDEVDGAGAATCAPASGSTFPVGTTTVMCTATDAAGHSASTSFTVTVTNTAPTFTAPADQTVEATSASGAVVTYAATGADAEDGPLAAVCAPASGLTFPLGTTIVNCAVTDRAGATVSGTFSVLVVDTTAPSIAATADVSMAATSAAGAMVTYTTPATTDLVDGAGGATCAPASGSTFPVGTTTVVCTAADHAGNTSTRSFVVTVSEIASTPGHMRGEGSVRSGGTRYEFDFDVQEGSRGERARFKLDVKDERGKGRSRGRDDRRDGREDREDKFVARSVTSVVFSDDPTDRPGRRKRPQVDTVLFTGTGTWNGAVGYTYEVYAEDRGEPGRHRESVRITIRNSSGALVASVEGELSGGSIRSVRVKH